MSCRSFYLICFLIGFFLVLFQEFVFFVHVLIKIFGLSLVMFSLYNLAKGIEDHSKSESFIEYDEEE
mgnify:FL=1